jgi:hypothetical protein
MPQAKIKSVQATGRSWLSQKTGKTNYGFTIEFENGDKGDVASLSQQYPYPTGTMVTYSIAPKPNGLNGNNITGVKKAEVAGNGNGNGKSTYNDPEVIKGITMGMCQEAAIKQYLFSGKDPAQQDHICLLAGWYYEWVMGGVNLSDPNLRDVVSKRYYSLLRAVEFLQYETYRSSKKEKVVEIATMLLEQANNLSNEKKN